MINVEVQHIQSVVQLLYFDY